MPARSTSFTVVPRITSKPSRVYRNSPILYGCGDFVDDYEGISGYEEFHDDLVLMYFPTLRATDGVLIALEMVPLQVRTMRLNPASTVDRAWVPERLDRECGRFGTSVGIGPDGALRLQWR